MSREFNTVVRLCLVGLAVLVAVLVTAAGLNMVIGATNVAGGTGSASRDLPPAQQELLDDGFDQEFETTPDRSFVPFAQSALLMMLAAWFSLYIPSAILIALCGIWASIDRTAYAKTSHIPRSSSGPVVAPPQQTVQQAPPQPIAPRGRRSGSKAPDFRWIADDTDKP